MSFAQSRKASLPFIFFTIFLDALGLGILIPILPDVIRRFSSDPYFVNQYFGYFISIYALVQFFASPMQGALADKFGRRPVLLVSLFGASVDYLLMAYAPNLWLLFLGRIISGITCASFTVASSYIADISDDSSRSANFGLIGAGWGLGFIAGPMLGGFFGTLGPEAPFLASAALNMVNFLFGLFVLPESLPPEKRRNISLGDINPFRSLFRVLKPSPVFPLIVTFFLTHMAGQSHPSVWTLYTQYKFGWSALEVGFSLSAFGVGIAIVQGGLTRVIIPKLGEARALKWGLLLSACSYVSFALATQGWMMYAIMVISTIAGVHMPALQSMISSRVPSNEQGELQGSLMSLASLTAILGPLLFTGLFADFTAPDVSAPFPGISYSVAGMFSLSAFGLLIFNSRGRESQAPVTGEEVTRLDRQSS